MVSPSLTKKVGPQKWGLQIGTNNRLLGVGFLFVAVNIAFFRHGQFLERQVAPAIKAGVENVAALTQAAEDEDDARCPCSCEDRRPGESWWETCVRQSEGRGPLIIKNGTISFVDSNGTTIKSDQDIFRVGNTDKILNLLKLYGVDPKQSKGQNTTIINIGLPTESVRFAQAGFAVEAFEARYDGYLQTLKQIQAGSLTEQQKDGIRIHQVALSNYTGNTTIFDANDSSSLLESAVNKSAELIKFKKTGKRKESVRVVVLDDYVTEAVAMKIDTQGVEPEIFMGAEKLWSGKNSPLIVLTEYCHRMRPFEELAVGIHLLHGLGYRCHGNTKIKNGFKLTSSLHYCEDFVCVRDKNK